VAGGRDKESGGSRIRTVLDCSWDDSLEYKRKQKKNNVQLEKKYVCTLLVCCGSHGGGKKVDDLIVDWERADFLPKRKGELRLIIHSLPREIHRI
jgi:hypothetical protein